MSDSKKIPEPGIYYDIPFEEYLSWHAVSNSRINLALRSLSHYKHAKFKEPTKSLRLGSFIHCGVLEPLAILSRYAVMPNYELDLENRTKDGSESRSTTTEYVKKKRKEFADANKGKSFVSQDDYETLLGISKSLSLDADAKKYLSGDGKSEVSIVWQDEDSKLICKARIDYLTNHCIADLKTTQDSRQAGFEKSLANFGYHRQAAHYLSGWEQLTGEILPFVIVAAETTIPYLVTAQPVCEEAISVGREEVSKALKDIAKANMSNKYPGYEKNGKWRLPAWYKMPEIELISNGQSIQI